MNTYTEELQYEEKMDRITEYLEELMLDAMLVALDKIMKRNWQYAARSHHPKVHDMQFWKTHGQSRWLPCQNNLKNLHSIQNNQQIPVNSMRKSTLVTANRKKFPDYIVAHELEIPYYEPLFFYENSFEKKVVYRKANTLPEDHYPFEKLMENYMKADTWGEK